MVVIECENCGKRVRKPASQVAKWNHHFCNKICHNQWRYRTGVKRKETSDWTYYNKLKNLAKRRKEVLKDGR